MRNGSVHHYANVKEAEREKFRKEFDQRLEQIASTLANQIAELYGQITELKNKAYRG